MPINSEKVAQLLSDSRLAFLNQQNETALRLAKEAIKLESFNPDAYKCAANAYMSMERFDDAIKNYKLAVKYDPENGNRYYDLGFACATTEKITDAMQSFSRAEELGCIPENLVQLYNILGIICFDIGRYDDALINLSKAEQIIGVDMDILQRKAIIYGINDDINNGLMTANQIKMVAPSDYRGYQIAFKLLTQDKRLEAAQKELEKAQQFAKLEMDYYFDCMTFELELFQEDQDPEHLRKALAVIEEALGKVKPSVGDVIESYINAAEIYLQLYLPDQSIDCLNAALNPVGAFNNRFEIVPKQLEDSELSEYDIEQMMEADRQKIAEELGEYGLERLVEDSLTDEFGNRAYLTEIDDEQQDPAAVYMLDESAAVEFTQTNQDQINRLFIGAYGTLGDFNKVIEYARQLTASESVQNSYIGRYYEASAMRHLDLPEAAQAYEELIKFFRNAMIKDPTDLVAVSFRIQCYADIGEFDEAEQLCNLLTREMREPLLEKINEARTEGVTENFIIT